MTSRNAWDARATVNARDGQDAYARLLQDLGLRDRSPFGTLRDPEGPFAEDDGRPWDADLPERDPGMIDYARGHGFREVVDEA